MDFIKKCSKIPLRLKSLATGLEIHIFAIDIYDKGCVPRIYKEHLQLKTTQFLKIGKSLDWIDNSPKKISQWWLSMWKDVQHQ